MNIVSKTWAELQQMWAETKRSGNKQEVARRYWQLTKKMLDDAVKLPESDRLALMSNIQHDECPYLIGIAREAAIAAIRDKAPQKLQIGLLALLIENCTDDYRVTLTRLCMLDHSARRIGVDLEDEFRDIRWFATPPTAELFDSYFRGGDRNLATFGYQEVETPDGINFKQSR
ncbi:MAG: hypothetical protein AB7U73_13310 [Pirellulales bacterium]